MFENTCGLCRGVGRILFWTTASVPGLGLIRREECSPVLLRQISARAAFVDIEFEDVAEAPCPRCEGSGSVVSGPRRPHPVVG